MRRSKFGNVWTEIDGIKFQSKAEARRYEVLRDRQTTGMISDLRLQVSYPLTINGAKIATYRADFVYIRSGGEIVEDVKGVRTDLFKLKKKLMKALHGIEIYETGKANDP